MIEAVPRLLGGTPAAKLRCGHGNANAGGEGLALQHLGATEVALVVLDCSERKWKIALRVEASRRRCGLRGSSSPAKKGWRAGRNGRGERDDECEVSGALNRGASVSGRQNRRASAAASMLPERRVERRELAVMRCHARVDELAPDSCVPRRAGTVL